MLWNAKNGSVQMGHTRMHYVSFGYGSKPLVLLPGLADGLASVKGKALLLARPYSIFFQKYTVYMFSRKNDMPEGYAIRDMAHDQAQAMEALGMGKAAVMGVSQGGMIAQYVAVDYAQLLDKLVIAVSVPRANDMIRSCVSQWISFAEKGNYRQLMIDTAEKNYSAERLKKIRKLYPLIGVIGKRLVYDRFLINARAILQFDASQDIKKIACPTLIIGAEKDKVVGVRASYEMNERIAGSELYVYKGLGHAAYEEAGDFNQRVFHFLESMQ